MQNSSPLTLSELQDRCQKLSGLSISSLAEQLGVTIPDNMTNAKGLVGQLVEMYLGASAGSKALPDFPELGVELKTIPVSKNLKALESTYVCTVQANSAALSWRNSWVYNKLKHVLWVPIMDRVILGPFFWQMDSDTEEILQRDWEELMEMMQLGYGKSVSAKYGTYLHIRPKAANSQVLIDYLDADGNNTKIVPKGFYLRSSFTSKLLQESILHESSEFRAHE